MVLDASHKAQLLKACFLLAWFRVVTFVIPFKHLTAGLRHHTCAVPPATVRPRQLEEAQHIGKLIATAAGVLPWQSRCLVQVLVVQRWLAARGVPGQFYLGVRKGNEDGIALPKLAAHAWLECGGVIVNGAAGHEQFTIVSTYGWGGAEG